MPAFTPRPMQAYTVQCHRLGAYTIKVPGLTLDHACQLFLEATGLNAQRTTEEDLFGQPMRVIVTDHAKFSIWETN